MCTAAVRRLMLTPCVVNVVCVLGPGEPAVDPIPVVAPISAVTAVASIRPRTLPYLIAPLPRSCCQPPRLHAPSRKAEQKRRRLRDGLGLGAPAGQHRQNQEQTKAGRGQGDESEDAQAQTLVGDEGPAP